MNAEPKMQPVYLVPVTTWIWSGGMNVRFLAAKPMADVKPISPHDRIFFALSEAL
jgi:hypothetical protein